MRLSVLLGDPGYDLNLAFFAEVTVDGKLIDLCMTADEEEGFALCYVRDPITKKLVLTFEDGEEKIKTEVLKGVVHINLEALPRPEKLDDLVLAREYLGEPLKGWE